MQQLQRGLEEAWASIATFLPKLAGFLIVLLVGWFAARAVEKVVDRLLERVGFDRWIERGGVGKALARSKMDASSILAKIANYVLLLFVLQLAFGLFGSNPISALIASVIAYLPKVFAAIVIVVVGAAIAAAVKEIVEASLGGLSYGRGLAMGASVAVLAISGFAALDQLEIAPTVVNTLFMGLVAAIVGAAIIAVGGGGIPVMRRYWERAAERAQQESGQIRQEAAGAQERIQSRFQDRTEQLRRV